MTRNDSRHRTPIRPGLTYPQRWHRVAIAVGLLTGSLAACSRRTPEPATVAANTTQHEDQSDMSRQASESRPLFPRRIGAPDPIAERVCTALHTSGEQRKARCCMTSPADGLTSECVRTLSSALRDGAVAVDLAAVDQCVEDTAQLQAGCEWVTPNQPPTATICHALVHGQLAAGAVCRSSLECRAGLHCSGLRPTTSGVCVEAAATGAPCSEPLDALAIYTGQTSGDSEHPLCQNGTCARGRCDAFAELGGTCQANRQCPSGSHCASGHCVSGLPPSAGESCTGTSCAPGGACVDGLCAALKSTGALCHSPFECKATCVMTAAAKMGTCGMQCSAGPIATLEDGAPPAARVAPR